MQRDDVFVLFDRTNSDDEDDIDDRLADSEPEIVLDEPIPVALVDMHDMLTAEANINIGEYETSIYPTNKHKQIQELI